MHDDVNSPSHYTQGELEVIEIMETVLTPEEFRGYCKGNILKYSLRAPFKGAMDKDYKKAKWYYNRLHKYSSDDPILDAAYETILGLEKHGSKDEEPE